MENFKFVVDVTPTNTFEVDESKIEAIVDKYRILCDKEIRQETYKQKAVDDRKNKGLKLNRITSYELRLVLEHWFKGGRGVLQKSFNYVYENTGKLHKEVDWCVSIPKAKHYGEELVSAMLKCEHPTALLIKNSKVFNKTDLMKRKPLTWRMREMDVIARFEEELEKQSLELETALARIAELEGKRSWKEIALEALAKGSKQKDVALLVNKSLPTIKRLVADNRKDLNGEK